MKQVIRVKLAGCIGRRCACSLPLEAHRQYNVECRAAAALMLAAKTLDLSSDNFNGQNKFGLLICKKLHRGELCQRRTLSMFRPDEVCRG